MPIARRLLAPALAVFVAACGGAPPSPAAPTSPGGDPVSVAGRWHGRLDAPRPSTPGPVTIVAAGDIACDPSQNTGAPKRCDHGATSDLVAQLDPTAVLILGDNAYERGSLNSFENSFDPSWGRFRSIMYPTPGNHEYLTHDASGYFAYFGAIDPYYSFDLGAWHLISLNSECSHIGGCDPGSPQEVWLRQDLAAHQSQCTLAYWHEPRWSSGEHGNAKQMTAIWNDLAAAGADVVLSGHNHDYERFEPLDANGNPDAAGVTEFVVGTGGRNRYPFTDDPLPGEAVRDDTSFGVLQLTLGPSSFAWRYVPAPGYAFTDSGQAACH